MLRSSWTTLSVSNLPSWGKSLAEAASPTMIENYSDAKQVHFTLETNIVVVRFGFKAGMRGCNIRCG